MSKEITVKDFFNKMKVSKSNNLDKESILESLKMVEKELEGAKDIGQMLLINKLEFMKKIMESELKLIENGYSKFVWLTDMEKYIANVEGNYTKTINLEHFERLIPEIIREKIKFLKDLKVFDNFMVVYNDPRIKSFSESRSQKAVSEQSKKKRNALKDPIVFGYMKSFIEVKDEGSDEVKFNLSDTSEKLYFVGDWIDDYCDLTLEQVMDTINKNKLDEVEDHDVFFDEALNKSLIELGEEYVHSKKR